MVSADNYLTYPDYKITFTVHTNAYDKQLIAVISNDNKSSSFFSIILIKAAT